jgi:methionyl-tRNA formyltransferase
MNQRIIFMGTPAFAAASLNALVGARMEVAGVVTAPDRPAGRGRKPRMSAVKERALELGLPVMQPEKLRAPEFLAQLDALHASLYVVVAFRMLPEIVWNRPALGTINLHASLLPDYRGAAPINWAIINGERRTGVSTFFISADIDTGDILLREEVNIHPDDNAGLLHDRMKDIGATLLVRTVKDILDGTVSGLPQSEFVGDALHNAPKLTRENCRIDWTLPSSKINDLIRGLSPVPGAWTLWKEKGKRDRQFKVLHSRVVPEKENVPSGRPGSVLIKEGRLLVECGKGVIEALMVQPEGKDTTPGDAFVRGLRAKEWIQLE